MKRTLDFRPSEPLREDVLDLVKESAVAEASARVFEEFQRALQRLDADSIGLLQRYFEGASLRDLSREWGLTEGEIDRWIGQKRRELIQHLRQGIRVKQ